MADKSLLVHTLTTLQDVDSGRVNLGDINVVNTKDSLR